MEYDVAGIRKIIRSSSAWYFSYIEWAIPKANPTSIKAFLLFKQQRINKPQMQISNNPNYTSPKKISCGCFYVNLLYL